MKKIIIILLLISAFIVGSPVLHACENCTGAEDYDWCDIQVENEDPENCILTFQVHFFWTCADGWDLNIRDIPPIFFVELPDECTGKYEIAWSTQNGDWRKWGVPACGVICSPPGGDCNCACPPCCGVNNQSESIYFVDLSGIQGNFRIWAEFKGDVIYDREFHFNNYGYRTEFLGFDNVELKDMSGHTLSSLATLDIDEPVTVEASADWSEEPFEETIYGVIKSTGSTDSLLLLMNYVDGGPSNAFYSGTISGGSIRQLYGNPETQFANDHREILTIYPNRLSCPPSKEPPAVNIYVGLYRFFVVRVKFIDDYQLCEETNSIPPTELITEPEWVINGQNKPVCYSKGEYIRMDAVLSANFNPHHTLFLTLQGIGDEEPYFNTDVKSVNYDETSVYVSSFLSTTSLPDMVTSREFSYHWVVYLTPFRPPRLANTTGPHKIFVIYDTPVGNEYATPTNTLGLTLVCDEYARGAATPDEILTGIMDGIYSESNIYYNPGLSYDQYTDPYDIYRSAARSGQCNAFARFFLVLSQSVGLCTNKSVVYSGYEGTVYTFWDEWWNKCRGRYITPYSCNLWCQGIIDPQGHDGSAHGAKCESHWDFGYHVMASYNYENVNKSYDAVYNLSGNLNTDYGNWLTYYYTTDEAHIEPPDDPPGVKNWNPGDNPVEIFSMQVYESQHNLSHPVYNSLAGSLNYLKNINTININSKQSSLKSQVWTPYYLIPHDFDIDNERGDPYSVRSSLNSNESGRKYDIKKPGDYLISPTCCTNYGEYVDLNTGKEIHINADSMQNAKIAQYLLDMVNKDYCIPYINDNIFVFKNVLDDSNRTEYYGRFQVKDTKFTMGGWFDKFAVVGVFCKYDGVEQFLEQARKYLNLPEIELRDISVKRIKEKYYYSVQDSSKMILLRGFGIRLADPADLNSYWDANVIEYIKYYDKEFMP
jgi:hypothetical protein